jgi:hypothetical protein
MVIGWHMAERQPNSNPREVKRNGSAWSPPKQLFNLDSAR